MTDLISTIQFVVLAAGILLGLVAMCALYGRLGWSRTCALMAVWVVAADSSVRALNRIVAWAFYRNPPDYWSVWPRGWRYLPLAIQALVAVALVVLHLRDRRKP